MNNTQQQETPIIKPHSVEMHELIIALHRQVLEPCRNRFAKLKSKQEGDEKSAQDELARATKAFDETKHNLDMVLSDAESNVRRISGRLESQLKSAQSHLEKQNISIPDTTSFGLTDRESDGQLVMDLSHAEGLLNRSTEALKGLCNLKRPENVIWPNSDGAGWAILALGFVLAIVVTSSSARGSNKTTIFFFTFMGVYVAAMILVNLTASSDLRKAYQDLSDRTNRIESELKSYSWHAQQEHQKALGKAEFHYNEARHIYGKKNKVIEQEYQQGLAECRQWLASAAQEFQKQLADFLKATKFAGAGWQEPIWQMWQPATSPAFTACLGQVSASTVDLKNIFQGVPLDFMAPALIPFADGKCLLVNAQQHGKDIAIRALQAAAIRLLATIPPSKVRFTLIDPIGLGQNVAALMPLGDIDKSLIDGKAWSEPSHIEQRLADLTEHMETVIQKYLRKDYQTIEDYNQAAKRVAEPYRVLMVLDFPVNFNETAARRLVSIARNGPRCGVYTLIFRDLDKQLPYGFNIADLEQVATVINQTNGSFVWQDDLLRTCQLILDQPPNDELAKWIVDAVGAKAKDAMKVEVPFDELLEMAGLSNGQWWHLNSARGIRAPLGPTGARKAQYLTLGDDNSTEHHGLIVGRPGSGKTNLMHVIISTLALAYSPEELRLYLVDFKKGVGFKPYADYQLPHAIAIAIESEREFGLSVLQGLDAEMQRRGELFRRVSVEKISEYREKNGAPLPRLLLVADEFQEFFTQDDNLSRQAALLLDRLVRQGRAFGVHVLLGTQTLQGYSLAKSTLDQMTVRIAMQCSDADSRLILADDNPAARLLSRPGEAIYNAQSGLVEGNNLFQVALFNDSDRDRQLKAVSAKAAGSYHPPIVFEGNEPANLESCHRLQELLDKNATAASIKAVDAFLGEPTAIRPPVVARLRRQSDSNLIVFSRDEAEGVGMVTAALLSLAIQQPPAQAQFFIVNVATADSEWAELPNQLKDFLPHEIKVVTRRHIPELLEELMKEVHQRVESQRADAPAWYLFIIGLQRVRELRQDDDAFDEGEVDAPRLLLSLLREGPEIGIHTIIWCDTYANLTRVLPRRPLREFGLRAAAVMSEDDSRNVLDDGAAARLDKPHRAIFYDDEHPGQLEKFRPFRLPGPGWLDWLDQALRSRNG
jgi:hypothetical protein